MARWGRLVAVVSAVVVGLVVGVPVGGVPAARAASPAPVVPVNGAARGLPAGKVLKVAERGVPQRATGDFANPPGAGVAAPGLVDRGAAVVGSGESKVAKGLSRAAVEKLPVVDRGEKFTVFDAGGGDRVARLFAAPVNGRDGQGRWAAIDPSLRADGAGRVSPVVAGVPMSFAASSGEKELVRAGGAGRAVAWGLVGASSVPGVVKGSAITYPGVVPGVDVEFRAGSSLVKTTVVVHRVPAAGEASWRFPLSVEAGLTPVAVSTGGVEIRDGSGAVVASVPTPVMWDAKADPKSGDPGVYGPVRLSLEGDAESGWVVVLSADEEWLRSPARVFPVSVDPTVSWTAPNVEDAFVASGYPNSNYSVVWNSNGYYENRVGQYDGAWGEGRTYLRFDLGPLTGARVHAAQVGMYFPHAYQSAPSWTRLIHVGGAWSGGSVTWNAQPAWGGPIDFSVGAAQWAGVDVTDIVAHQVTGEWANQGFAIAAGTAQSSFKRMASMENTNGMAPYLDVVYNWAPAVDLVSPAAGNGHVPAAGQVLSATVTEVQGDPVSTAFTVGTNPDGVSDLVWGSPWQPAVASGATVSVTVPPEVLAAGRTYYWKAIVYDGYDSRDSAVRAFTPVNTPPAVVALTSPGPGQAVSSLTPTLVGTGVTDPDGDAVKYWFTVATGSDGLSGQVVASGWVDAPSWTVPAGVLRDGVPYTWRVRSSDRTWLWHPETVPPAAYPAEAISGVGRFRLDLKLGLSALVPTDAVAGVSVNMVNGNAVLSAASPAMSTLGGAVGVSLTYNSATPTENGLTGQYFDGLPAARDFPAGEVPRLTRTDAAIDFDWGAGSPFAPAVGTDQFRVRWTGFVAVPETGTYLFGATHDNGTRVTVGSTTVFEVWDDTWAVGDYTNATPVALTAGEWKPITVEYFENTITARVSLLAKKQGEPGPGAPVPSSWLSTNPAALPTGWSLSADVDGEGGYVSARTTDSAVVLTDSTGSIHTWTKRADGSYTPPVGEYGTLSVTPATATTGPELVLVDESGTTSTFDAAGALVASSASVDDRRPASATYAYGGTPRRLTAITDPLSNRQLTFTYQRTGETCPAPPAGGGYDAAPPAGMLCRIGYPDGSATQVLYAGGRLSAIMDPGSEMTHFAYTGPGARLSGYRDPVAADWAAAAGGRDTAATWTLIGYDAANRVEKISSPEPTGTVPAGGSGRLFHQYGYPAPGATPPVATMKVNNDSAVTTSYETDASGRPVRVTNPAGQVATATWNSKDLPVWTKDHTNRITATVYDALDRPTDTWGPYPDTCFTDSTTPDGTTVKSPVDTPACKGSMPHTTTGYDQGLTGLAATWWNNLTLTGTPAGHSTTTTPGGHGTSIPHSTVTSSSGYSARYTGHLTLPEGSYTLAATDSTIGDDGFRLYLDDQLALERWSTYPAAVTADQPAGYWRLGEGSGSIAAATVGGNASYTGPVALNQPDALTGQPNTNTSASFPSTAALTLPGSATSATNSFTVEAWVKPAGTITVNPESTTSVDGTSGQRWLFVPAQGGTGAGAGLSVGTNAISVYEHGNGYLPDRLNYQASTLGDGNWHHVALVYSGRVPSLYVDGQQVATGTTSPRATIIMPTTLAYGTYGDYEGGIDEVATYPRALDGASITAHYRAGRPTFTSTSQATGPTSNGQIPFTGNPTRVRLDYKNPTNTSSLELTAQQVNPSTGAPLGDPIPLNDTQYTPGYGLTTSSTTDDTGIATAGVQEAPSTTSTTKYSDPSTNIDPTLGLATSTTSDPGGLTLTSTTSYETYAPNSLLRPTSTTPPSGSGSAVTTAYYAVGETRSSDGAICGSLGQAGVNQNAMAKTTTNPTPATGPAIITDIIRDVLGRVVATGTRDGAAAPATWSCTAYDSRGRTLSTTIPAFGAQPQKRTVSTDYAAPEIGALPTTKVTETLGTTTTSTTSTSIDLLGRVVTYSHSVPGTSAVVTTSTSYDTAGRVSTAATTSVGVTSVVGYTYTPDGRTATVGLAGTAAAAVTPAATVAAMTYDATSKDLTSVSYGTGTGSSALSVSDLTTVDDAGRAVKTTWSVAGRVLTDEVTRSRAGRVLRAVATDNGATTSDWSYVYDGATRLSKATLAAAGARPQLTLGYGFASTGGCGADAAAGKNGSRTATARTLGTGPTQTSTYCTDKTGRPTAVTGTDAATFTYNTRGNATKAGTQTWTYDGAGRVATAATTTTGGITLTYTRDPSGRLLKRAATNQAAGDPPITLYGYSSPGDTPDAQLDPTTGALTTRYLTLPGGLLLTTTPTGITMSSTWALTNLHGDTTATLTGTTVSTGMLYEPYGQPLNPATATPNTTATPTTRGNPTTLTDAWAGIHQRAYEHTATLNQTHMGARTYLPAYGCFTTTDPIPGGNTTPYTYPQDPINGNDYTGLRQDPGISICRGGSVMCGSNRPTLSFGQAVRKIGRDTGVLVRAQRNAYLSLSAIAYAKLAGGQCQRSSGLHVVCIGAPHTRGGLTVGDVLLTSPGSLRAGGANLLRHEERHSLQYAILGLGGMANYYPSMALSSAAQYVHPMAGCNTPSACYNPFEVQANLRWGGYVQ